MSNETDKNPDSGSTENSSPTTDGAAPNKGGREPDPPPPLPEIFKNPGVEHIRWDDGSRYRPFTNPSKGSK